MDADVSTALQGIQHELGRLANASEATNAWLKQLVADDRLVQQRVGDLEKRDAERNGTMKVLAAVGTVLGAIAGGVSGSLFGHHR